MTICVAWKQKGEANVHLASDSRVSCFGRHSDYCIKIFPVPIRIHDARDSTTGTTAVLFQKDYGFGFAGSTLGVQTIREFLFILLQRLQVLPVTTEVSFSKICDYVSRIASHLIEKLSGELEGDHLVDFFMTGYCPSDRTIKIAKFFRNEAEGKLLHTVFKPDFTIQAIGARKSAFSERIRNHTNPDWREVLRVLNEMTQDTKEESVGGNIQFGGFDRDFNFETRGIMKHSKNESGMWVTPKYCMAGIDMNGDEFTPKDGDFFVIGKYINPFPARA